MTRATRVGAALLAGTLSAGAGAIVATHQVAVADTARAKSSLSVAAARQEVNAGRSTRITGRLQIAGQIAEGRDVTLQGKANGEPKFQPVNHAVAGAGGNIKVAVEPEVTTRYRWQYRGADDAAPRLSGVVKIEVRMGQRTRRVGARLSARPSDGAVPLNGSDVISGKLRGPAGGLRHKTIVLLSHTGGTPGWEFRATRRTGMNGEIAFTVWPKTSTEYKLTYAGSGAFRPAVSPVVKVDMRPIIVTGAEPATIEAGESAVVSGVVTHNDSAVAGATVELEARKMSPVGPWLVPQSTATDTDGSVYFTVTPATTTQYRLRVVAAAGLPSGRSQVVEVRVGGPGDIPRS